jgi:CHAT domain-containing protein/tetratricopeptide (TPR) repeat protein
MKETMSNDIEHQIRELSQQLSELYQAGDYLSAIPIASQLYELVRRQRGDEHSDVVVSLTNLALLYQKTADYVSAETAYSQVIAIANRSLREDDPIIIDLLVNFAELYTSTGNYARAEPLLKHVIALRRQRVDDQQAYIVDSLSRLAAIYIITGRSAKALPLFREMSALYDQMIAQSYATMPQDQWLRQIRHFNGPLAAFLSLVCFFCSDSRVAVKAACDLVLRRKGKGIDMLAARHRIGRRAAKPLVEANVRKLQELRSQITTLVLAGPGTENPQAYRRRLKGLQNRERQLKWDLDRSIAGFDTEQGTHRPCRKNIARMLPIGTALVEFVRFSAYDFEAGFAPGRTPWKAERYLAFVMHAGRPEDVQMVDLGDAEPLDRLIADFRATITGEVEHRGGYVELSTADLQQAFAVSDETATFRTRVSSTRTGQRQVESRMLSGAELKQLVKTLEHGLESAREEATHAETRHGRPSSPTVADDHHRLGCMVRAVVFDPLLRHLNGCQRLFLAPDGNLMFLPFEALPLSDKDCLVDSYHISYVSTGRDIPRFGHARDTRPTAPLVAADPDFDLGSAGAVAQADAGGLHNRRSRDIDRSNLQFTRLTGTQREGEYIAAMFGVQALTGGDVLKSAFKACRSPWVLHIATHGFFLPDQRAPSEIGQEYDDTEPMQHIVHKRLDRIVRFENPLLRSGLALAGANTWLQGGSPPASAEDGLLTAEDIVSLDLSATELVVLSACETGIGEVREGEGIFGLRQALVLAGTKTLVISLWKVPDRQTQQLMVDFFRRLLEGQPRAEALREAQLAMKAKHPNPFYWSAFICQGDPGMLPSPNFSPKAK